jgi:hypothetical protein
VVKIGDFPRIVGVHPGIGADALTMCRALRASPAA